MGGKAAKPKSYAYPEAVPPTQTQIHLREPTALALGASSTQSQRDGSFIPSFGSGETQSNRTRGDGKRVGNLLPCPEVGSPKPRRKAPKQWEAGGQQVQ